MGGTAVRVGLIAVTVSLATSMAGAGAQEGRQLTPTGAVQVTGNPNPVRNYSSPLIARNPKNGQLAIGSVDTRGNRECVVHLSNDDGRSWAPGGGLMTAPFTDCSIGAEWGSYFRCSTTATACCTSRSLRTTRH